METKNNLNLITSFGDNFIKVDHANKIIGNTWLLNNNIAIPLNNIVKNSNDLTIEILEEFFSNYTLPRDIFLVGCGNKFIIPNFELRAFINKSGFNLEWMITKSAIQTWNILMEDYRDVLALIFLE